MVVELTSAGSAKVKAARRLAKRAFRSADGLFLAEGPQAVREALRRPGTVVEVFATAVAVRRHADLVELAESQSVPVHRASGEIVELLAQTVTPQGIVGVCRAVDVSLDAFLETLGHREQDPVDHPGHALVAMLSSVRDPGNAGAVIRCADAAGAQGVVMSGGSVDVYNGKCVRSSAGSVFHLPICVGQDMDVAAEALRGAGFRVLAADGAADLDLDDAEESGWLNGRVAWLFGNEAWGLDERTTGYADEVIRVPIHGQAESLNLATAAAVCLYATARAQRRMPDRADPGA